VAAATFSSAFVVSFVTRDTRATRLLLAMLACDVIGAVVLAPLAVGEVRPIDAPVVLVVLATLGVQPAAAVLGAVVGQRQATATSDP